MDIRIYQSLGEATTHLPQSHHHSPKELHSHFMIEKERKGFALDVKRHRHKCHRQLNKRRQSSFSYDESRFYNIGTTAFLNGPHLWNFFSFSGRQRHTQYIPAITLLCVWISNKQ